MLFLHFRARVELVLFGSDFIGFYYAIDTDGKDNEVVKTILNRLGEAERSAEAESWVSLMHESSTLHPTCHGRRIL